MCVCGVFVLVLFWKTWLHHFFRLYTSYNWPFRSVVLLMDIWIYTWKSHLVTKHHLDWTVLVCVPITFIWATVKVAEDQIGRDGLRKKNRTLQNNRAPQRNHNFQVHCIHDGASCLLGFSWSHRVRFGRKFHITRTRRKPLVENWPPDRGEDQWLGQVPFTAVAFSKHVFDVY